MRLVVPASERLNTDAAIMERYTKANLAAIAGHQSIMFDSIRDVLFLLKERKDLLDKMADYGNLSIENELLKEEVTRLKEELANVRNGSVGNGE